MSKKKSIEVLFKTRFQSECKEEGEVRALLEGMIPGLSMSKVEMYVKGSVKAVVTSNVLDIIMGKTAQGKGVDGGSGGGGDDGAKEKEIQALKAKLKEAVQEHEDLVEKLRMQKEESEVELKLIYESQIKSLMQQTEEIDREKGELAVETQKLTTENLKLNELLNLKNEIKKITKGGDKVSGTQREEIEKKFLEREKQLIEDRDSMQEKVSEMNLRLLAEMEKAEKVIGKAKLSEKLERRVELLEREREDLMNQLRSKDDVISSTQGKSEEKQERIDQLEAELGELKKNLVEKSGEVRRLQEEKAALDASLAQRTKELKGLQEDCAKRDSDIEGLKTQLEEVQKRVAEEVAKSEQLAKQAKSEQLAKQAQEKAKAPPPQPATSAKDKQRIEALEAEVKKKEGKLQEAEKRRSEESGQAREELKTAVEQFEALQKKHDVLVKELTALRQRAYESEKSEPGKQPTAEESKHSIAEEMAELMNEVVYVYKTLDTNSRQYLFLYQEKTEKVKETLELCGKILKSKKKDEQLHLLQSLTLSFMEEIEPKPELLGVLLRGVEGAANRREGRLEFYSDQVVRLSQMLKVAGDKIAEYEAKLASWVQFALRL